MRTCCGYWGYNRFGFKTHTPCIYLPIVLAHLVLSREFGDLGEVIDVAQKKDRAKDCVPWDVGVWGYFDSSLSVTTFMRPWVRKFGAIGGGFRWFYQEPWIHSWLKTVHEEARHKKSAKLLISSLNALVQSKGFSLKTQPRPSCYFLYPFTVWLLQLSPRGYT